MSTPGLGKSARMRWFMAKERRFMKTWCRALTGLITTSAIAAALPATAQPQFVFKFKPDQHLFYETDHSTTVELKDDEGTKTTATQVRQIKEWHVLGVDSLGVATIEMSIKRLSLEMTSPDGAVIRFDSTDSKQSHPDLVKQLGELVGKPILRVQMAPNGSVKESTNLTDQKNLLRELPFYVAASEELPVRGMTWTRDFPISMEPPHGTGHAYKATQLCNLKDINGDLLTVHFITKLIEEPKSVDDRLSIMQSLPTGQVVLDWKRGVMTEARLQIDQRVNDVSGKQSHYAMKSSYHERLVEGVPLVAGKESKSIR